MKISVIIPTYSEAETIGSLIGALENEFLKIPRHDFNIVVVDANSPDGTGTIIKELQKKNNKINLISEEKLRGLGMAYIDGMKYAIASRADAIMEFDGDFQHDPKDLPKLVAEFDNGYDYIIGSRYVPGGEIPEEWSRKQKLLSKYGSIFIKKALALPTNDNTSGFKLSRVANFAENLPLDENKILSRFHAYKIHLLHEMHKMGAKTKEVPIKFLERAGGSSKSTPRDIFESLKVVAILKARSLFI